jgi:hypothetical protein
MPCMKCSNGKWKYGVHGNCQFDTLDACHAAAAAIHIQEGKDMYPVQPVQPVQPMNPHHDATCQCASCKGMYPKYK